MTAQACYCRTQEVKGGRIWSSKSLWAIYKVQPELREASSRNKETRKEQKKENISYLVLYKA